MKKILLGTTALVLLSGAAAAQQVTTSSPFTVTLGGSIRYDFAFFDEDVSKVNRESRMDVRLFLKAEAKADNGLVYGFDSRIRTLSGVSGAVNSQTMIMDKKVVYAKGTWGNLFLGDWDDVRTQFEVLNPQVGIGQADTNMNPISHNATEYWATEGTFNTKISYVSPSFAGFQAGVSYTPENDSGRSITKGIAFNAPANRLTDQVDLAAAYTGTFGSVGLKVGGGYGLAQGQGTRDDASSWNLGAQVSFAGFTVGGFYFNQEDAAAAGTDYVDYSYGAGVTYATGPWGVGLSAIRSKLEIADETDSVYGIGGAYKLAPGLSLQSDLAYVDSNSLDNNGWQLVLRTRVDF